MLPPYVGLNGDEMSELSESVKAGLIKQSVIIKGYCETKSGSLPKSFFGICKTRWFFAYQGISNTIIFLQLSWILMRSDGNSLANQCVVAVRVSSSQFHAHLI